MAQPLQILRIVSGGRNLKEALAKLKAAALLLRTKFGLAGFAALGLALYLSIFRLAELILSFAALDGAPAPTRHLPTAEYYTPYSEITQMNWTSSVSLIAMHPAFSLFKRLNR